VGVIDDSISPFTASFVGTGAKHASEVSASTEVVNVFNPVWGCA